MPKVDFEGRIVYTFSPIVSYLDLMVANRETSVLKNAYLTHSSIELRDESKLALEFLLGESLDCYLEVEKSDLISRKLLSENDISDLIGRKLNCYFEIQGTNVYKLGLSFY